MEQWDHTAWICLHQPRMTKKRYKLEDFHPMRGNRKQVSLYEYNKFMGEARKILPKTLSNEEIEQRWLKYKKEKDNG